MTDFAKLEHELMVRARGALEPEPHDRTRLREALAAKIAAMGAVSVVASTTVPSNTSPLRHLFHSHLAGLSTVAALSGVLAFGAGYYAGQRSSKVIVKTVSVARPEPASDRLTISPITTQPLNLPSLSSSLDLGHSGTRPRVTTTTAPSAPPPSNSLSEELDLLRRAERTIRSGNAQVALGLLQEMDEKFPKGQLVEERTAARVMARCQLDDTAAARARGNAYLLAHSQSVYADRVRSLCRLESTEGAKVSPKSGD